MDIILMQIFLVAFPFLFGGFYEFPSYIAEICILIIFLIKINKENKIKFYVDLSSISLVFIAGGFLISSFYGIDMGMGILGFLKFSVPLTFSLLIMQYSKLSLKKIMQVIPYSGMAMIFLSLIFKQILPNGRLGGFFQYSNTFALYLLIGIIYAVNNNKKILKTIIEVSILLIGIYLTGSRTTFILTVLCFIFWAIKFKKARVPLTLLGIGSIILTIIYANLAHNFGTIGRYLTMFSNSSTLLGRLLYYKDAIPVILKHPFGLGYYGYSYIQKSIQTGIYTAVFVHNDFLQFALDIGIIPAFIFIIAIIKNLICGKRFSYFKQILLVIILHTFLDFDLQFMSIFLILVLTLNYTTGKKYVLNVNKTVVYFITTLVSMVYLYFAICTIFHYIGKSKLSLKLYPIYTEANENIMYKYAEKKDFQKANKYAGKILETNTNCALAYNVKALYYASNQNWKLMLVNKQKSLELNKYDMENIEEYVLMLSMAVDYYANSDELEKVMEYIKLVVEVPKKIERIKNSTSSLAYKINDKPNFELSREVQEYINRMEEVMLD